MKSGLRCTIVIPCYNEAARLDSRGFLDFLARVDGISFLFVDDCSRDRTVAILEDLQSRRVENIAVLRLTQNGGKGEAVRLGMLEAIKAGGAEAVGFWDADLATPLDAIIELLGELESNAHVQLVFGSRVKLLGRAVHRRVVRHYLGRMFATTVSILLQLPIYDTQCGAKLFRVTPQLEDVLATPFLSRWVFDVELLTRFIVLYDGHLARIQASICEYPLRRWDDVTGSKVRPLDFVGSFVDLVKIYVQDVRPRRAMIARISETEKVLRLGNP